MTESEAESQEDALHAAVRADPASIELRMMVADWYEDHGFPRAAAIWRQHVAEMRLPRRRWDWAEPLVTLLRRPPVA